MSEPLHGMVARRLFPLVRQRLADEPVILLEGARSVGKSTLLRDLAAAHRATVIDLDDVATRDAVAADPATFMAGPSPVCLDEYQKAPLVLRLTPAKLFRREAASLTEVGHLLETFVVGELLRQVSWLDDISGTGHWRTRDNDEVDLVVERDDGALVAFEVKTAGRVPGGELRGLRKLRDAAGDAFLAGVVLYLGERSYTYEDRLHVMPVDRLWGS